MLNTSKYSLLFQRIKVIFLLLATENDLQLQKSSLRLANTFIELCVLRVYSVFGISGAKDSFSVA